MINILNEYFENGEFIKIVYNGGSQKGTIRELLIVNIEGDKIRARTSSSRATKSYLISKIELYDEKKHKNNIAYSTIKPITYSTIEDILKNHNDLFKKNNLTPVSKENSLKLFDKYKNGNLKKKPIAIIEYSEYRSIMILTEDGYEEEGLKESSNPWDVRFGKKQKSFKHFEKAVISFIDGVKEL